MARAPVSEIAYAGHEELVDTRAESPVEDTLSRVQLYTVPAGVGTVLYVSVPGIRFLYVNRMASLQTTDGELEIALGRSGEFFRFGSGMTVRCRRINTLRLRNLTVDPKSVEFVMSIDPSLSIYYSPSNGPL